MRIWYWKGTLLQVSWEEVDDKEVPIRFDGYNDFPDYEALFFVDNATNTLELRRLGEEISLNALTASWRGNNIFDVTARYLTVRIMEKGHELEDENPELKGLILQRVYAEPITKEDAEKLIQTMEPHTYVKNQIDELLSNFSG